MVNKLESRVAITRHLKSSQSVNFEKCSVSSHQGCFVIHIPEKKMSIQVNSEVAKKVIELDGGAEYGNKDNPQ